MLYIVVSSVESAYPSLSNHFLKHSKPYLISGFFVFAASTSFTALDRFDHLDGTPLETRPTLLERIERLEKANDRSEHVELNR